MFQYWQCDTLDNVGEYTDEANYVSLAVKPNGLAMIAYGKDDEYINIRSLIIIYQYSQTSLSQMNQ